MKNITGCDNNGIFYKHDILIINSLWRQIAIVYEMRSA